MFGVFRDYLYSSGAVVRGESEIINDFVFATIRCLLYYMLLVCSTYKPHVCRKQQTCNRREDKQ